MPKTRKQKIIVNDLTSKLTKLICKQRFIFRSLSLNYSNFSLFSSLLLKSQALNSFPQLPLLPNSSLLSYISKHILL